MSAQPYLDTDQDGLPDFWEATFTTNLLYITSNNNDRDGDGYTDLEEYDNWLAGLHAVTTVTNPVAVDLYQLCGNSGHLAFFVSNSVHGSVYLTNVIGSVTNTSTSWSNTIAVFTPTNDVSAATNYTGYASFTFYATNLDTSAYFGPNTVSVIVSAVPILTNRPINIITLTNGVPYDSCEDYGSDYYHFVIPTNAYGVIFELQANSGPMALAVAYGQLPSVSSYNYFTNVDTADGNLEIVVLTNSMPVPLQTGDWYMAAINENPAGEVCYGAKITYLQNIVPPELFYPTNTTVTNILETVPMTISCVATDLDSPTLPLYYAIASGPAGMTMTNNVIYWTPTEAQGPSTNSVAVSVSNGAFTVTNTFAIIVLESNLPPVLPVLPPVIVAIIPDLLVVTNTATDPDIPSNTLSYMLTSTITSTNLPVIDPNGVISWTPTDDDAGSNYVFTTVVTDYNPWAVNTQSFSVTNSFVVFVPPLLPPEVPETNIVQPNSINWFAVKVPVNAIASSNMLLFATLPVNLWFSPNNPPAITNAADTELLANVESGISVLTTNRSTAPTNIVPGKVYFLGVQNLNSVAVTNAVVVKFRYAEPPKFSFFSIVQTNLAGTNGFLLTWYAATNYQFHLQWTRSLAPAVWNNFNGVISYTSFVTATNSQFQYFDDGSQAGDFSTNRFYRLLLLNSPSNTVPFFVNSPAWFTVNLGATFVYTNSARDWDIPAQSLSYSVTNTLAVTNLTIDPAGVITWTPALTAAGLTNFITTTVVDSGVPAGVFTNIFAVVVSTNTTPAFTFGSVTLVTNGMKFQWTAAANEQFQIRWTTNLAPANWTLFPDLITSATSSYSFVDTNTPSLMEKFYQLMLVP